MPIRLAVTVISIILKGKICNLAYSHGARFEFRLARKRIARTDGKIIGGFKKPFVSAPVKRQKTRALDNFFSDSGLEIRYP